MTNVEVFAIVLFVTSVSVVLAVAICKMRWRQRGPSAADDEYMKKLYWVERGFLPKWRDGRKK